MSSEMRGPERRVRDHEHAPPVALPEVEREEAPGAIEQGFRACLAILHGPRTITDSDRTAIVATMRAMFARLSREEGARPLGWVVVERWVSDNGRANAEVLRTIHPTRQSAEDSAAWLARKFAAHRASYTVEPVGIAPVEPVPVGSEVGGIDGINALRIREADACNEATRLRALVREMGEAHDKLAALYADAETYAGADGCYVAPFAQEEVDAARALVARANHIGGGGE